MLVLDIVKLYRKLLSYLKRCVVLSVEADRRGELFLMRTEDLGKTFTTIAHNIFSFGYVGGFLFTSVIETLVRDTHTHIFSLKKSRFSTVTVITLYFSRTLPVSSMCRLTRESASTERSFPLPPPSR